MLSVVRASSIAASVRDKEDSARFTKPLAGAENTFTNLTTAEAPG